ncbi:hypothetical protein [Sorangium sp. So ce887]|uniref:hypothetical protein n=1 Tax=Sorangium sp. So ce887 TaxID=3133324 RepID=UPI003F616F8F
MFLRTRGRASCPRPEQCERSHNGCQVRPDRLRGDQHNNYPGENLSKALLTVAQIMDSKLTEIGLDAGRVTSPLAGIQV